jgi:hypothetical protein
MTSILDRISRPSSHLFVPATADEFFALRLAKDLGEPQAVRHYVQLLDEHKEGKLLVAYRRASQGSVANRALRFHQELSRLSAARPIVSVPKLAAIKVERRSIAAAVFIGNHLDYTQVRQLSSQHEKAEATAIGFTNWIIHSFSIQSVALELQPPDSDIQRAILYRTVTAAVRASAASIWEISLKELLAAYGHPALKFRNQLRDAVRQMWKARGDRLTLLDAVALGLYVQTERSFLQ